MILIFYYINNNLNHDYIVVTLITRRNEQAQHHIEIEHKRILSKAESQDATAAQQPK